MFDRIKLYKMPETERTTEVCLQAVKLDWSNLQYVPLAVLTDEMCLECLDQNGNAFKFIPPGLLTAEMCISAVDKQPSILPLVLTNIEKKPSLSSPELINQLCMLAITNNPSMIKKIPDQFLNAELYMRALTKDALMLKFVLKKIPSELFNPDWYWLALKSGVHVFSSLSLIPQEWQRKHLDENAYIELLNSEDYLSSDALISIPKEMLTFKLCAVAVEKSSHIIMQLPDHLSEKELDDLYLIAVKNNPRVLEYVPQDKRSEKICLTALATNDSAIGFFPPAFLTREFCLDRVKNNGWLLQDIPKEIWGNQSWANELCAVAVKDQPQLLRYGVIPSGALTQDDYLEALNKDISIIEYVPSEYLTSNMYLQAVKADPTIFKKIPKEKMTSAILKEVIYLKPKLFEQIIDQYPDKLTEDVCLQALNSNSNAIDRFQMIPSNMRSEAVSLKAVELNWECLQYVSPTLSNIDIIYSEAVKNNGLALQFIPEAKITEELCVAGVMSNDQAITKIPKSILHKALCEKLIEIQPRIVIHRPGLFSDAMLMQAIEQNPFIFKDLPIERMTEDMAVFPVSISGMSLEHVPVHLRTEKVCWEAVKNDPDALEFVPHEIQTEAMCLDIVKKNGQLLKFVSPNLRTLPICLAAMEESVTEFEFVPESVKESIINKLTVEKIIGEHYLNFMHLPEKYQNEAEKYLANIKYISVINNGKDHELLDSQLIYAESKKGRVISLCGTKNSVDDIDLLLNHLKRIGNTNALQLAYIDHANVTSTDMCGVSYQQMATLCKNHPTLKYINLMGCHTAITEKPEAEKEMILAYAKNKQEKSKKNREKCGLISSLNKNHEDKSFQAKCLNFCKKNALSSVYVINKKSVGSAGNDVYELIKITCHNEYKECTISMQHITPEKLDHILDTKKKIQFPTEKKSNDFIYIRNTPVTESELQALRKINKPIITTPRFEKSHPKYKKDKATYPFLATFDVSPEQLSDSLTKKLANQIQEMPDITWDITIKGITKYGDIDTFSRDLKVSATRLHGKNYTQSKQSLFKSKEPNVNRKKLEKSRAAEIKNMLSEKMDGESSAKKIRTTVKKHK